MSGTDKHNNATVDEASQASDFSGAPVPLDGTESLHPEDIPQAEAEEPKGKKTIFALTALGVVVLVFAIVVIFYAVQLFDGTESTGSVLDDSAATGEAGIVATESFLDGPIVVARETDYIFYNANYDGSMHVDPDVGTQVQPEDEELVFPPGGSGTTATSGGDRLGSNYSNLRGIDVLPAQAMAQAAGYVVHQVFVVPPAVVNGTASAPRPGEVVEVQTYTMRTDGQRYMFLHVMTTEPVANARAVPNLVGTQWRTGRDRLSGVGLGARFEYERNSPGAVGEVIFQAPQPGSYTPARSTVIMVLAD
ncbi:MAG: PASTA domain-containing protein [Coriobacteriia bacterium]|nr:PASTA domain-containing protein [Coriobacteriia bacterium]